MREHSGYYKDILVSTEREVLPQINDRALYILGADTILTHDILNESKINSEASHTDIIPVDCNGSIVVFTCRLKDILWCTE